MKQVLTIGAGDQSNVIANMLDGADDIGGVVLVDLDQSRS